jgi:hypothetical protein
VEAALEEFFVLPPFGGGGVRHMVATPDRRLYQACQAVSKVAVVELAKCTGELLTSGFKRSGFVCRCCRQLAEK